MPDWKSNAELILVTFAEICELWIMTIIPTPNTSMSPSTAVAGNSVDKVRAIHLSAFLVITVLGLWLMKATVTGEARTPDALLFIIFSAVFFTVSSWIVSWVVWGLTKLTDNYIPGGQSITDALTLVLGFNFIVIVSALTIKQADIFFGLGFSHVALNRFVLCSAIIIAAIITLARSMSRFHRHGKKYKTIALLQYGSVTIALSVLSGLYLNIFLLY